MADRGTSWCRGWRMQRRRNAKDGEERTKDRGNSWCTDWRMQRKGRIWLKIEELHDLQAGGYKRGKGDDLEYTENWARAMTHNFQRVLMAAHRLKKCKGEFRAVYQTPERTEEGQGLSHFLIGTFNRSKN